MNKLTGTIVRIESSRHMSIVDVDVEGEIFSSIVLEIPATSHYLKEDNTITLVFKETEVSLAKNLSGTISLRNRFKGTVQRVEPSEILTKITLQFKDKEIVSIISTRSAQSLELKQGDDIEWLVKTNEVSLLKDH